MCYNVLSSRQRGRYFNFLWILIILCNIEKPSFIPRLLRITSNVYTSLLPVKDRNFTAIVTFFLRDSVISGSIVIPMALRCHSCSLVILAILFLVIFFYIRVEQQIMDERHEARVLEFDTADFHHLTKLTVKIDDKLTVKIDNIVFRSTK